MPTVAWGPFPVDGSCTTACCGARDFCDGGPLCTEGASTAYADLSGIVDALADPSCPAIAGLAALNDMSAIGSVGGYGDPWNGAAVGHGGYWYSQRTAPTGFFKTATLTVSLTIVCTGATLYLMGIVEIICGSGSSDLDEFGVYRLTQSSTDPFNCIGPWTLTYSAGESATGGGWTWPATLVFHL